MNFIQRKEPRTWAGLYSNGVMWNITKKKISDDSTGRTIWHEVPLHRLWALKWLGHFISILDSCKSFNWEEAISFLQLSVIEGNKKRDVSQHMSKLTPCFESLLHTEYATLELINKDLELERFAFTFSSFVFVSFPLREHWLTPHLAPSHILRYTGQVYLLIIYHVACS